MQSIKSFKIQSTLVMFLIVLLSASSCTYNKEEILYGNECNLTTVTYSGNISPLISTKCAQCHNDDRYESDIKLNSYVRMKEAVNHSWLLGSIRHQSGYAAMPQDAPMLSECAIKQLTAWIDSGAPNN